MLEQARENARVAGIDAVTWHEGDTTELSFEKDSFDVTLSALGHMYGDPPDVATREMVRITRPGGRIGFTAWRPTGLFPAMAGVLVAFLPPEERPEFSEPPFMWGDPDVVAERLAASVEGLESQTDTVACPAMSPGHFWQELVTHSGLFISFLENVDDRSALREQMIDTIEPYFVDEENVVELEYLLTTATVTTEG
jgi:SAM-dependent methyltransferase